MINIPYFSDDKNKEIAENILQESDIPSNMLICKNYRFSTALDLDLNVGEYVITRPSSADSFDYTVTTNVTNSGTYIVIKLPKKSPSYVNAPSDSFMDLIYEASSYVITSSSSISLYNYVAVSSTAITSTPKFIYARTISWMIIRII